MGIVLPFRTFPTDKCPPHQASTYRLPTKAEALLMENLIEKFRRHLRVTKANSLSTIKLALEKLSNAIRFIGKPAWLWSKADVIEFLNFKLDVDEISTSTLAGYHNHLRCFQNFILSSTDLSKLIHHQTGVMPCKFIPEQIPLTLKNKSRKRSKNQKILSKEECERVLDYLEFEIEYAEKWNLLLLQRDKAIFTLLITMGLRVNELVNVKKSDFIILNGENNEPIYSNLQIIGKGDVGRCIDVIFDMTNDVIAWYLQEVRWAFIKNKDENIDWLFYSERGGKLSTQQIRNIIMDCCSLAGIEQRITPHMLRHSYATHIMPIIGASATRKQLGHANLATTFGTYFHPNVDEVLENINQAASRRIKQARDNNNAN